MNIKKTLTGVALLNLFFCPLKWLHRLQASGPSGADQTATASPKKNRPAQQWPADGPPFGLES